MEGQRTCGHSSNRKGRERERGGAQRRLGPWPEALDTSQGLDMDSSGVTHVTLYSVPITLGYQRAHLDKE